MPASRICTAIAMAACIGTAAWAQQLPDGKPQVGVKKFAHTAPCPGKCKTCTEALKRALDYLANQMSGSGIPARNADHDVVINSIGGLAFLANGSTPTDGPYAEKIEECKRFVMSATDGGGSSYRNWAYGFAAMFLSEYQMANPTPEVEERLKFIVGKIAELRDASGGWGHSPNFDYGDFVSVSSVCLAGLGAAKTAKIPVPEEVIKKATAYIERCGSGDGRLGYSPKPGEREQIGKAGRSAAASYALARCGVKNALVTSLTAFAKSSMSTVSLDHSSPTLHFLFGGLFAQMNGVWKDYSKSYTDLWLSAQKEDGSFVCPMSSDVMAMGGMDVDRMVGPNYPTAVFALVFALPLDSTNVARTTPKKPTGGLSGLGMNKPTNGWIGVKVVPVSDSLLIKSVVPQSPGEKAELAEGDAIIEVKGKAVKTAKAARDILNQVKPGAKVTLTVLHEGEKKQVEVVVAEKPKAKPAPGEGEEF